MISIRNRHIQAIAGGILILSGLLASGCKEQKEKVLSEREMVDLIVDLKLAEAYANSQLSGPNPSEQRRELAKSVLAEHNVTQEQLDTTLGWYGRNLDKYAELYEKVDKRLLDKRKKLLKNSESDLAEKEGDNFWLYGKNSIISTLGNNDGWIISLSDPDLGKGDRLEWTMHINNASAPLMGVLGVDYDDGTSEAVNTYFTNRQHIELALQTDTGKRVQRVYGTMRLKKQDNMPLFADSIALRRLPYDSLEYARFRSQRKYGYPIRVTQEDRRRKALADSLRQDSIQKVRELRADSIRKVNELQRDSIKRANELRRDSTLKSRAGKTESGLKKTMPKEATVPKPIPNRPRPAKNTQSTVKKTK
ncbi:MAG: DUF4296 domain-containing protein [Muribaculaceae bacterium]|nr:DUF4296 domain-containing protein [Muribaculaceae bacterium]